MSGYGELDKFYDEMKIAYIFGDRDVNSSLFTQILFFLSENTDWSLSYYGEDYDSGEDLYIIHDRTREY